MTISKILPNPHLARQRLCLQSKALQLVISTRDEHNVEQLGTSESLMYPVVSFVRLQSSLFQKSEPDGYTRMCTKIIPLQESVWDLFYYKLYFCGHHKNRSGLDCSKLFFGTKLN